MIIRFVILLILLLSFDSYADKIELTEKKDTLKIKFFDDPTLSFKSKIEGQDLYIYFNHAVQFSLKDLLKYNISDISHVNISRDKKTLKISLKHPGYSIIQPSLADAKSIELVKDNNINKTLHILPIARPPFEDHLPHDKTIIEPLAQEIQTKSQENHFSLEGNTDHQKWFMNFSNLVSAAIFKKDNFLWIIFNDKIDVDLESIKKASNGNVKNYLILPNNKYTILRLNYIKMPAIKAYRHNFTWIIESENQDRTPLLLPEKEILSQVDPRTHNIFFPLAEIFNNFSVTDPEKGSIIEIVLSYNSTLGRSELLTTPEYEILNSSQGLAIEVISDLVAVTVDKKGVSLNISLLDNIKAQQVDYTEVIHGSLEKEIEQYKLQPTIINFGYGKGNFAQEWPQVLKNSVTQDPTERLNKLFEVIKIYTAHCFYREALGLCDFINKQNSSLSQNNHFIAYYAFLSLMTGDNNQALKFLKAINYEKLDSERVEELNFFRKIAEYRLGTLEEPLDFRANYLKFVQYYPIKLQQNFTEVALKYAIDQKDFDLANQLIENIFNTNLSRRKRNNFLFYKGLVAEQQNNLDQAKTIYDTLSNDSEDNFNRSRAIFYNVQLQLNNKSINYEDASKKLELAQLIWRGDDLELSIANYLAELHYKNKNFPDALRTWRAIASNFPNSGEYLHVTSKMSNLFLNLFEDDNFNNILGPVKLLALYYEFKELTPIGSKGDQLAANLVTRALHLDLIDEAVKILDYQTKYRLSGDKQDQAINQVTRLYIKDQKFDTALQYIIDADNKKAADINYRLRGERSRLKSEILNKKGQYTLALKLIEDDASVKADGLRAEIYWNLEDWPNLEKSLLYKLANPTQTKTNAQVADDILRLAISYNKQKKYDKILDIINKYPLIIALNNDLDSTLALLMNEPNRASYASVKKGLNFDNISNLLKEAKK
jgi:hypothetical protein